MKALTLYPEHAEMFRLGLRTIETRTKPTKYRGPLLIHAGMRDEHSAAAQRSPRSRAALDAIPHGAPLTHGAVVASAVLFECVPIVESPLAVEDVIATPRVMAADEDGCVRFWTFEPGTFSGWDGLLVPEAPFGDYSPGRFAWRLDELAPTTSRCPRCWGWGFVRAGEPDDELNVRLGDCPTCDVGTCAPIPMRGRLGLWEPEWPPKSDS